MSSVRFQSPALVGHAVGFTAGSKDKERTTALGMASSLPELFAAVPVPYRDLLKPELQRYADHVLKMCGVNASIVKLAGHKARGTLPPQLLGCKLPRIELTKEFSETTPAARTSLETAHAQFRTSALDNAIKLKRDELDWWQRTLSHEAVLPRLRVLIDATYNQFKDHHQIPTFGEDEDGETKVISKKESPVFLLEYERLLIDLPTYVSKINLLQMSKVTAATNKKGKKKELKDTADVEMGDDTTTSDKKISELVNRKVAEALKKRNLGNNKVSLLSDEWNVNNDRLIAKKRKVELLDASDEETQEGRREPRRRKQSKSFYVSVPSTKESGVERCEEKSRQRKAEEVVATSDWRYDSPDSYPDEILLIPAPLAIKYIIARAPLQVLEAARFRANVHLGPDVYVPSSLQIHLSAGLKYMFPSRNQPELLREAWNDFEDRLRWRVHFELQEAKGILEPRPYDPDYEIHKARNPCTFREPSLEIGLEAGRTYVNNYLTDVEPKLRLPRAPELVEVTRLRQYLLDHDYIVIPTDKNLGTAVVTRKWFIEGGFSLLNDPLNYREIDSDERTEILDNTYVRVLVVAEKAQKFLEHPQLADFLRSKIPHPDNLPDRSDPNADPDKVLPKPSEYNVPQFYGVPKIHKQPVKFRPIIPCHSAMQNPAAKYVSKMLKPLLAERPYLLRSSKDFAQKLSTLRIPRHQKIWLVTGDIVAYYPTIPKDKCINIVRKWWLDSVKDTTSFRERELFTLCLNLGMGDLITDFQSKTYLQTRGLAMGVAASPDLANLYGCYFEEKILPDKDFVFFGRFIDDVFAIVTANTAQEALQIAERVQYEDVKIEYSVSDSHQAFLDLLVYIDPATNTVEHKPFRKARNHLERIPWASHHPADVKRGTFIGEMSRLATLCSRPGDYLDALQDLRSLYIARGYPGNLVNNWLKQHTSKRWANRLGAPQETSDVFVLKSTYNQAWHSFNIHELGQTVTEHWLKWFVDNDQRMSGYYEAMDSTTSATAPDGTGSSREERCNDVLTETPRKSGRMWEHVKILDLRKTGFINRRWLVSRKRTRNLFDFVSTLRKFVLGRDQESLAVSDSDMDIWEH
jgi:hypothetical protein